LEFFVKLAMIFAVTGFISAKKLDEFSIDENFDLLEEKERFEEVHRYDASDVVDVEALLLFAKSCLNEILQHHMPSGRCVDPQNIRSIAAKLQKLLKISEVENFELMIDNKKLCYSYDMTKPEAEEKYQVTGCLTTNEIIGKLLALLFSFEPRAEKMAKRFIDLPIDNIYCFNLDTARFIILVSIFLGGILWVIFIQFQNSSTSMEFFKKVRLIIFHFHGKC